MYIVPDFAELGVDPLIGPPFKRASEIDANDLAEHTGIHAFEVIRRGVHRKNEGVQERRNGVAGNGVLRVSCCSLPYLRRSALICGWICLVSRLFVSIRG